VAVAVIDQDARSRNCYDLSLAHDGKDLLSKSGIHAVVAVARKLRD
jgi:hypothetical protein